MDSNSACLVMAASCMIISQMWLIKGDTTSAFVWSALAILNGAAFLIP